MNIEKLREREAQGLDNFKFACQALLDVAADLKTVQSDLTREGEQPHELLYLPDVVQVAGDLLQRAAYQARKVAEAGNPPEPKRTGQTFDLSKPLSRRKRK